MSPRPTSSVKRPAASNLVCAWPTSMAGLLKMVPASQVVFGTDFPYVPTALQADALEKNGLSAEMLGAIQHDNTTRLIPRLAA